LSFRSFIKDARDEHVDRPSARRRQRDQPPPESSRWRHDRAGPQPATSLRSAVKGRSRSWRAFAGLLGRVIVRSVTAAAKHLTRIAAPETAIVCTRSNTYPASRTT
jgi:hypothetical protein